MFVGSRRARVRRRAWVGLSLALAVVAASGYPARLTAAAGPDPADAVPTAPAPKAPPGEKKESERKTGFSLPGTRSSGPIHIDAKQLEFDSRTDVATFRGDVVTTQDDVVMHSAVLRVVFVPSEGIGDLEQLQTVVAEGDVRITQGNRVARGERAEFDDAARTLVLSGKAVLVEGSNEIRGERVIVYLDEERSVVEGTNSRVKAVLVPHGDGDGDGAKTDGTPGKQGKQGKQGKDGGKDGTRRQKHAVMPLRDTGATIAAGDADPALGDPDNVWDETDDAGESPQ
jgi:lipopolysaccharide export system protein LptA